MTDATGIVPNHHAHHDGFSGLSGFVAALSMARGRDADADVAIALAAAVPGDVVVDIGCGPGSALRQARRRGLQVIGVDPAPVMLRVARLAAPRADLRQGTAEHLPVEDGTASVAWSIACVHHWIDVAAGLAEVRRVLQPGGRFVAMEREIHARAQGLESHGWEPAQADALAEACRRQGFVDVHVERVTGARGPALAVVARR